MTDEINYYILALDDLENDLLLQSENIFKYYFEDKTGDFENISVENILIGYNKNSKTFNYLFIVKENDGNNLILEKRINNPTGGTVVDNNTKKMLENTNLIALKEEKFKLFYKSLISSILFNEYIHYPETYESNFEYETRQRIFFGAPGTGKSYTLNNEKNNLIFNDEYCERVTFHPDYSYANFVGTYKPVPLEDDDTKITYKYVPGPFLRLLIKARKNIESNEETKPFLLIIEEINRANVSAVFGDIFQLLDREANNWSEFPINTSEDMRNYLEEEFKDYGVNCEKLCLPSNFFIWATMNSADQGVFMMDTAFKRRWDFTYLGINNKREDINPEWNVVREAINNQLLEFNINEDKLLGPFFIPEKQIPKNKTDIFKDEIFRRIFKDKVIMYLFEDAAKPKRNPLFEGSKNNKNHVTYSEIIEEFNKRDYKIFSPKIVKEIEDKLGELDKKVKAIEDELEEEEEVKSVE